MTRIKKNCYEDYDAIKRIGRQETLAEVEKLIDEMKKLRLYRSKSCQLLCRILKSKLKELKT